MKFLVALSALMAVAVAQPTSWADLGLGSPLAYSGLLAGHGLLANPGLIAGPGLLGASALGYAAAPAIAAAPVIAAAPAVRVAAAPAAVAVAAPATKTQWHSQDELGQASFGHTEPLQTHTAVQDAHGNRAGSFSYLNPHDGQIHRTDYVADSLGYRVAANDLPLAPAAPVLDTPEVAVARAAHLAALHRARRSLLLQTPAATAPLVTPLLAHSAIASPLLAHSAIGAPIITPHSAIASPLLAHSGIVSPLAAHGVLPATLTTIVNNPGHAVSYRID